MKVYGNIYFLTRQNSVRINECCWTNTFMLWTSISVRSPPQLVDLVVLFHSMPQLLLLTAKVLDSSSAILPSVSCSSSAKLDVLLLFSSM